MAQVGFKVGDFVDNKKGDFARLIIGTKENTDPDYPAISLKENVWCSEAHPVGIKKIQPTVNLINKAKKQLKKALKDGHMDNLTYIEIYARLKEHEASLLAVQAEAKTS